ncbi:MAG: hypothetical protein HQK50_04515 [Oligoflexia bacterium]|nr:hypothetical protein [Oligoflexia bacterium]MBF0364808.1 hypothetical protein [Oligoflexia bacterium]
MRNFRIKENLVKQSKRAFHSVSVLSHTCLNSTLLPITLTVFMLLLLTVLFRMKRIELDYKYGEINQQISRNTFENKELGAQKAQITSIKSLNQIAQKYNLNRPGEKQIILIP